VLDVSFAFLPFMWVYPYALSLLGALDASFLSQLGLDDSDSDDDRGSKD
jgi:hypothetical protein